MGLRFAIFGTGFWSRFQLAGWQELEVASISRSIDRTIPDRTLLFELI